MLRKVCFISWRLGGPTLNSNGVNKCHATRPEILDAYLSWPLPVGSLTFLNQSLQIAHVSQNGNSCPTNNIDFEEYWSAVEDVQAYSNKSGAITHYLETK
jgi:hypothetical protein